MIRACCTVLLLTAIYAAALSSADPWDLLFGALLATGLYVVFRASLAGESALPLGVFLRRVAAFPPFAWAICVDIFVGTWMVMGTVLRLRPLDQPGIIVVPLGERSRLGVFVSALAVSLSPGSTLIEIDWQRRIMLLHLLDASDPNAAKAALERFYERYQRRVFP